MSTNVANLSMIARLGTTKRNLSNQVGWVTGDVKNVKSFGAAGDGSNDDTSAIQACFNAAWVSSATTGYQNYPVFFPPGNYKITSHLTIQEVEGARIIGSGKNTTKINNVTSGDDVIRTDGFSNATISDLSLVAAGGSLSTCFRWDQFQTTVGTFGLTWINVAFDGAEICFRAGSTAAGSIAQASECEFLGCDFTNASLYGLRGPGGNTLNWIFHGGRIQNCASRGIGDGMSVPYIAGIDFSGNGIDIVMGIGNSTTVEGCTSTSSNFFNGSLSPMTVRSCYHTGTGYFARIGAGATASIDGCWSTNGDLQAGGGGTTSYYLKGSRFDSSAYIATLSASMVAQNI